MGLKYMFVSVHLETVLILTQDSCSICTDGTIGSKIILMHPMELLGDVGHLETRFGLFRDSISVDAR
jgi:hypothetical protein